MVKVTKAEVKRYILRASGIVGSLFEVKYWNGVLKELESGGVFTGCGYKPGVIGNCGVDTDPRFWDCECRLHYIHDKRVGNFCPKCGVYSKDQPDSRPYEIMKRYKLWHDRAEQKRVVLKKS